MKRGELQLVFGFILILSMFFVFAQDNFSEDFSDNPDLKLCSEQCNVDYESEADISGCIEKCKEESNLEDTELNITVSPIDSGDELFEDDELYKGYEDEELQQDAGAVPGDTFYFIDKFFDRFADDLDVKEERIAEIKQLIEVGDIETAKIVLEDYLKLADKIEKEIDPERREKAKRSASAIRNAMKDMRHQLPAGEREEFVNEIVNREHSIATTVEIASKIKSLCIQLAELDPLEYSRVCKTEDDAPEWKKRLNKRLTGEQKKEAEKFANIMKRCFQSAGQECDCYDIPFPDFAKACSTAAPLATACDIEGDEDACEKLDALEMPELPPHLQEVFDILEGDINEAQYDMHMPRECREAGVTNPKECGKIMIEVHAPEECKEALMAADVKNEREGREICDKIMMEIHAPECADQGITNPEECQDYMFSIDRRPPECQKNDIHDVRDCKRFLERGPENRRGPENFGRDCRSLEDPKKRLECYDGAISGIGNYGEDIEEIKKRERECADKCSSEGGAWDFSGGNCK